MWCMQVQFTWACYHDDLLFYELRNIQFSAHKLNKISL